MSRFALAGVLSLAVTAQAADRVALLVGSRAGRNDQAPLRYTGADVTRVHDVLAELGGFAARNLVTLDAQRGVDVLDALERMRTRSEPADVFFFYYSGHGDSAGLQVGESALPLEALLPALRAVPATLRILVIDACQSGAATHRKGVTPGPPVQVRIDATRALGEVVISSSSADEESFESESLSGAVFTVHWVSGLRGAADEDADGAVTLSEAYRYAYARTVSSTLLSSSGPQRPSFRWDLAGHHEPVLATAGSAAKLTLQAHRDGSFFVFDSEEQELIAEVQASDGQQRRLLLAPGRYVIRQRTAREVRSAQVELAAKDDRILDDAQMEGARLVRLARKGGVGQWALTAHAGQMFSGLGQDPFLQVGVGGELEHGIVLWGLDATYLSSSGRSEGLSIEHRGALVSAQALFGLRIGVLTLRAGPALGAAVVSQSVSGHGSRTGTLFELGVRVRLEVELSRSLALLVMARGESWWGRAEPPFIGATVALGSNSAIFFGAGWALGLRASF